MASKIRRLVQGANPLRTSDALRAAIGALGALGLTGIAARAALSGHLVGSSFLVPPVGASAVLVFTLPASPLAQPRAVLGGNLISALVGLACAHALGDPLLAACVAVGLAIVAMGVFGCLHPPGGAVALGTALAGSDVAHHGVLATLAPLALGCGLLVSLAAIYLNATGRTYPHRVAPPVNAHDTRDSAPADRIGYTRADLDRALARYGDVLDVSREDLDALFREVELQAHQRIHRMIRCEEIMSRDLLTLDEHQPASSALAFLQQHDLRVAPVLDAAGRVVGMARRAELLGGQDQPVGAVLDPYVLKVRPEAPIETLLPLLSSGGAHEAMVVDQDRRLIGVITQTDLLAVLYRAHVLEAVAASAGASAARV